MKVRPWLKCLSLTPRSDTTTAKHGQLSEKSAMWLILAQKQLDRQKDMTSDYNDPPARKSLPPGQLYIVRKKNKANTPTVRKR